MRLLPATFQTLPPGSIRPMGWLHRQLQAQADGLTGHLDEFWPSVAQSKWIGGESEGWERAPYWLDGLLPLAFALNDEHLLQKARRWIDYILEHQADDGWFGAKEDPHAGEGDHLLDPWPQFVLFKVFIQWHEATSDERIIPAMQRAVRRIARLLEEKPLTSWARMRWPELLLSVQWLYEHTGETWLYTLFHTLIRQGYPWHTHFQDFIYTERATPEQLSTPAKALALHGVNNAMSLKAGALCWRWSGSEEDRSLPTLSLQRLDQFHGQITGMFAADEHFAGRNPSQGTELCTVVEMMYSLETLLAITGDSAFADRLERIAFNALPGGCTPDMWAHVYHQQINQVLCSVARRDWVSSGRDANIYGLEPNFGCCTANLHQGWPKFNNHLVMKTSDGGLAVAVYAPCQVSTDVGNGIPITLTIETDYPFNEVINILVEPERAMEFSLRLRIPAWATEANVCLAEAVFDPEPGTFFTLTRVWQPEDRVEIRLPMRPVIEPRGENRAAVLLGPLVLALPIRERFQLLRGDPPIADWEIYPNGEWNYGLLSTGLTNTCIYRSPIPNLPFAAPSPLSVTASVRQVAGWRMENHSAAKPPPTIELDDLGQVSEIDLVPFGTTHLRIAEFPLLSNLDDNQSQASADESGLSRLFHTQGNVP